MKSVLGVGLVWAFAFLLVAGAPLVARDTEEPAAKGKVTSFEAGKSISVESGGAQKQFKITADTKIEGDLHREGSRGVGEGRRRDQDRGQAVAGRGRQGSGPSAAPQPP